MNKSNTTSILNSQYSTRTSQIDHREMMGVDWTAMLSKAHSSVPRRIRKKPFSPQFSPQLFFVIQNFSPATMYAKAPLGFTAAIPKLLSRHYFPNITTARGKKNYRNFANDKLKTFNWPKKYSALFLFKCCLEHCKNYFRKEIAIILLITSLLLQLSYFLFHISKKIFVCTMSKLTWVIISLHIHMQNSTAAFNHERVAQANQTAI